MGATYTPGLTVAEATSYRKERRLPLRGEVCVLLGDEVASDTMVARTALPGPVTPINLANRLGVEARALHQCLRVRLGETVEAGEVLAESPGFWGWFRTQVLAPCRGTLDLISTTTGQVMLRAADRPVHVQGYTDGIVVEVMPGEGVTVAGYGALIQGIFGVGGEVVGALQCAVSRPDEVLSPEALGPQHRGAIVVAGSLATHELLLAAVRHGVGGLIVGGIDDADLRAWLGYDLGVAITGHETLGLTLIVTEGFGRIPMATKTFELLRRLVDRKACINGATQIRAGVMRPEILVPWAVKAWPANVRASLLATTTPASETQGSALSNQAVEESTHREGPPNEVARLERAGGEIAESEMAEPAGGGILCVGAQVRLIREPHFGALVEVVDLPVEAVRIPTEALVRVVTVDSPQTGRLTVPRANVEITG